jgi:multicomponent Na+:H+ antiporter subunit D
MSTLPPLPLAVPLLAAAALTAAGPIARRRFADSSAVACGVAVTVLCGLLLADVWNGHTLIYWFSGWHPQGGVAIGINFAIDPLGAGMATLVSLLVTVSLVYSWRYFEAVTPLYHVLMLVFLGAMAAFCLTGDLFNMFVLFELMSVAAYALTGYKIEEPGPLQGALNFAITNSLGGFMTLLGTALIYGRTGALNLAQIGNVLAGHHPDGLVVVAFALVITGFLVKAAVAPFHFWLADAHAVAPVPVCVLFSGVMVELGLYAVARIYWTAFSGALGPAGSGLDLVLISFGALTAVVGAVMCVLQRHLKRLLAFSTVAHSGMFLTGIGVLGADGITGSGIFILAHAFTKGALFLLAGIIAHRLEDIDELDLHGRGRALPVTGACFAIGGLLLASLPPFGPFLGKGVIDDAASTHGFAWVGPLFALCSALSGGAILRASGRIFLGLGPVPAGAHEDREAKEEEPETVGRHDRTPAVMMVPAMLMLAAGLVTGLIPGIHDWFARAAHVFVDRAGYAHAVFGRPVPPPGGVGTPLSVESWLLGGLAAAGGLLVAVAALWRPVWAPLAPGAGRRAVELAVRTAHAIHSGHVGDYVTWLVLGVGALGGAVALAAM